MFRRKEKDGSTVLEGGGVSISTMVDALFPVGAIYMTTVATNPGTGSPAQFPGTTWVAWGAGRAVVGVGSNGVNTYTVEQTFGVDSITLTAAQCSANSHVHAINLNSSTESVFHAHGLGSVQTQASGAAGGGTSDNAGNSVTQGATSGKFNKIITAVGTVGNQSILHVHNTSGNTDNPSSAAAATAHENRQASIATYLWKRTA